jgi:hypothetical protein
MTTEYEDAKARYEETRKRSVETKIRTNTDLCVLLVSWRCNIGCDNCVMFCSKKQAPSNEMIKLERIEYFLKDTIDCNKKYKDIALFGGEPTLHPQFKEICIIVAEANKKHKFSNTLTASTNGYAQESVDLCAFAAEHGYNVENSKKDELIHNRTQKYFYVPTNVAPIDVGGFIPELNGCWYSENAGIAFDNNGYWACCTICAAARVFDYEPTCTSIKDFTEDKVIKSFEKHCKICGLSYPIPPIFAGTRANANPDAIDIVTKAPTGRVLNQTMSKTWVEAFARYHEKER